MPRIKNLIALPFRVAKHGYYFVRHRVRLRFGTVAIEQRRLNKLAAVHGNDLHQRAFKFENPKSSDIFLFSTMRNEAIRLPYFFDYYRKLGVRHFFIVDNGSDDGSVEYLNKQDDVSWWHTNASYRDARFGMDWLNFLLNTHGADHWCITVDPDEFLVFPHCDTRSLQDLTSYLDNRNLRSFGTILLDMYPNGPVSSAAYEAGMDPLEIAPFYDEGPYFVQKGVWLDNLYIQGGPRLRQFFSTSPSDAPALNKTPLIKWKKGYVYRMSMHDAIPAALNMTYGEGFQRTTGALLHFKFLNTFFAKVAEEKTRKQHYNDGAEYSSYALSDDAKLTLYRASSKTYEDWQSLERSKLISTGGWF